MAFLKKNFAIVLAFALPILLILGLAVYAYLPGVFLTTQYDFLYATCGDTVKNYPYNCQNYMNGLYKVVNGTIVVQPVNPTQDLDKNGLPDATENYPIRIFFHDTLKNESREITLADAQVFSLSGLLTSPDGVSVSDGYSRGSDFFIFGGGSSYYGYYLSKGRRQHRLHLINDNDHYYYNNNFKFLGWVLTPHSK